jgi:cytoskeletal protein RodZ
MDIGGDLRRARTARHLSLAEISDRTKINGALLRAIEDNRFDRVPPGLFTRGYLRAYAREVELDPEPIVERYRAEFEPQPAQVEAPSSESLWESVWENDESTISVNEGRSVRQLAGLAVVLLISVAYFSLAHRVVPSTLAAPTATDSIEPSSPAPKPTSTTGAVDAGPTAPMKLTLRTTGDCWVVATVDGKRVFARLMRSREQEQFDVREEATLHVGDPATFTFTLDGMPGRSLGAAGVPANLAFTRQNYSVVLRPKAQ